MVVVIFSITFFKIDFVAIEHLINIFNNEFIIFYDEEICFDNFFKSFTEPFKCLFIDFSEVWPCYFHTDHSFKENFEFVECVGSLSEPVFLNE